MSSARALLLFALPAIAAAEVGRVGGGRALRGSPPGNGTSPQEAPEVASSIAAAGNDPCWIHQACNSPPGYSDTGSMGRGWYCTDGVYVDGSTSYDPCNIHEACHVGVKFEGGVWMCNDALLGSPKDNGTSPQEAPEVASSIAAAGNDPCWIHKACNSPPGYSDTGSMGRGWYCTDGMYVDGSTSYDPCSIHEACHVGVKFEGGVWMCNDGNSGSGIFGQNDNCYIHKNCQAGAGYSSDNTASLGNGWYCADGQYVDASTPFDNCHIHKNCGCGASFKLNAWFCNC